MGGDHKCPVCQATFTRPQHVARHMRSHTGDRPYKCQYCGDQFARSDLLARHVNKCHANEKQIPAINANRRKGAASASRATTSKQACDQCVQSSLPCDGCNPCAKCVQRKYGCTYVKFHRQTAPTGPGHNPRPSSAQSRIRTQPHVDDFIPGPPPLSVPSMFPNEASYSQTFNFPHMYPPSDNQIRSGTAMIASNDSSPSGVIPGLYPDSGATAPWFNWGQDPSLPNLPAGQGGLLMNGQTLSNRYATSDLKSGVMDKDLQGLSVRSLARDGLQYPGASGLTNMGGSNCDAYLSSPTYGRPRSGSLDFGSDSSSTSQSIPSSAASSSIHLPLDPSRQQQMIYHHVNNPRDACGQANQAQYPVDQDPRHSSSHPNLQREGGFSSAFGLMSIDDPNVISGLSSDGAPFFSTAAMNMPPQDPNITPMPPVKQRERGNTVSSSHPQAGLARDAETRELRDFWKAYIHTPLTGPSPSDPDTTATHGGTASGQRQPTSPNGTRRVRVASLPSVKTPTADANEYVNGSQLGTTPLASLVNGAAARATMHGNVDDLRSYEAAVLARKAPKLNFTPRKGREGVSASSASPPEPPAREINISAVGGNYAASRPSSSSSSSSLAFVFGGEHGGSSATSYTHSTDSASSRLDGSFANSPSRESSASEEASSDRPSFKRLPSQTLGPAYAKRALLSNESEDDGGEGPRLLVIPSGVGTVKNLNGVDSGMDLTSPRPTVGLTDPHRRMSNPTSHISSIPTYPGGSSQELRGLVQ